MATQDWEATEHPHNRPVLSTWRNVVTKADTLISKTGNVRIT